MEKSSSSRCPFRWYDDLIHETDFIFPKIASHSSCVMFENEVAYIYSFGGINEKGKRKCEINFQELD